jgi:sugar-phosphatase
VIEAAVFDMDGLLIDSEPLWQDAEIEIFSAVGLRLDRAQCRATRGRKLDEVVAHWLARAPAQGASVAAVRAAIVERFLEHVRERGTPKPGAAAAVEFLRARGLPLAVASSSDYRIIEAVLARLELASCFRAVHSGEDERLGKPHPAIFLGAARKLGVAPARCLAFEDSPGGVASAKAAGMRCVAVPDAAGVSADELPEERARLGESADCVIDSLLEVDESLLARLAG